MFPVFMLKLAVAGTAGMLKLAVAGTALAAMMTPTVLAGKAGTTDIDVPGTTVRARVFPAADAEGRVRPHYTISFDGEAFTAPRATTYDIKLRHGAFDPLAAAPIPAIEPGFEAGDDTNLYIVQFMTQSLEAYRDAIADAGGTIHAFFPQHSHVVRMSPETLDVVEAMPFVRWVGPFHPAYRLEETLLHGAPRADDFFPWLRYNIMVVDSSLDLKQDVARRIEALGGFVDLVHAGKFLVQATMTPDQLYAVVRFDDVLFIDRWGAYESDMDIARQISGADYVQETPEGWTGDGVRGEVIDLGFNLGHVDFASRPLIQHRLVGSDSHGAATSGIVFGDGTGNPTARGMVPAAQGMVVTTEKMVGTARYDLTAELIEDPYFAVFQTASVGSPRTTQYTTISMDHDTLLFDFDVLHCQSQSNAGNQDSRPQAWAKNVVSGGGVRHNGTVSKDDDFWGAGASIGPASDGRIKPTLTHFYDGIFTTTTGSSTAYTKTFGGTSGATPIICGHFGVFFDMWADGAFNNPVDPQGTVFDNRPHMATAKAMLVNTASQYDWTQGGPNADLDRFKQGWGMPDLRNLYDLRFRMLIVDETDLLQNLGSILYTVFVLPGEPALKATLVYTDPPGLPFASQHRINDLTLKVTSPSGDQYWGNNGLIEGLWSTTGGDPNEIDTVENVFVENPDPGQWNIEVIASEVVEDSHVETPELDVDFALVVSGVEEILPPLFMRILDAVPDLVLPGEPQAFRFEILPGEEEIVPGSEKLLYRFDDGDFTESALVDQGEGVYLGTVPGADCDDVPQFYATAEGDGGTVLTVPPNAPDGTFGYDIGEVVIAFSDDFETDTGWTVLSKELEDGEWERGVPAGGGVRGDPANDFDGSGNCFVTDNVEGNSDVDGGPTRLTSPRLDATGLADPFISYARWFTNDDDDDDSLDVEISDDDGQTWVLVESVGDSAGWVVKSWRIADYVSVNDMIRMRFSATDNPNDSVTEAGIDAVRIVSLQCEDGKCVEDLDGSGSVDFGDILEILSAWGNPGGPEDLDGSGTVDFGDILVVLSEWGPC